MSFIAASNYIVPSNVIYTAKRCNITRRIPLKKLASALASLKSFAPLKRTTNQATCTIRFDLILGRFSTKKIIL